MPYYKNKKFYISIYFDTKEEAEAFEEQNRDYMQKQGGSDLAEIKHDYDFCPKTRPLLDKYDWKIDKNKYLYRYEKVGRDSKKRYFHREACDLPLFGSGQATVIFFDGDRTNLTLQNLCVKNNALPRIPKKYQHMADEAIEYRKKQLFEMAGIEPKDEEETRESEEEAKKEAIRKIKEEFGMEG